MRRSKREEAIEPVDPRQIMEEYLAAQKEFKLASPEDRPALQLKITALHDLYCSLPH